MATDHTPLARCSEQPLDSRTTLSDAQSSADAQAQASPFIRTPLEIRHMIYRLLLTTPYAFVREYRETPYYEFCTAILRVNKQINEEAGRILYEENAFVEFRIKVGQCHEAASILCGLFAACLMHVPHLIGLCPRPLLSPVLTINVTSSQSTSECTEFITTAEGVLYVVRELWYLSTGFDLLWNTTIVFDCHKLPTNLSRLSLLNDQVLRPFDQIQLHKVGVCGDADEGLINHLHDYIIRGPTSQDVSNSMERFLLEGNVCFKQEQNYTAKFYWSLVRDYWVYRMFILDCYRNDSDWIQNRDLEDFDKSGRNPLDIRDIDIDKSEVPRKANFLINAQLGTYQILVKLTLYDVSTMYQCQHYLDHESYLDLESHIAQAYSRRDRARTPLRKAKFAICSYMMISEIEYRVGNNSPDQREYAETLFAEAVTHFPIHGFYADQTKISDRTQLARSMDIASLKFLEELKGTSQVPDFESEALNSTCSDVLTQIQPLTFWDFLKVAEEPR